jgi:hypothetical protein
MGGIDDFPNLGIITIFFPHHQPTCPPARLIRLKKIPGHLFGAAPLVAGVDLDNRTNLGHGYFP